MRQPKTNKIPNKDMSETSKPRQGKVQYSIESIDGEKIQRIFRSEGSAKDAVALYDEDNGIVEMIKGKESYKAQCTSHLRELGSHFREVCKIGTDIDLVPEGAPPMPKKSRIQGEKTTDLVEWYARYRPDFFLDKYAVTQLQALDRVEHLTKKVRGPSGHMVDEPYTVNHWSNMANKADFDLELVLSGRQRLLGRMKTHITHKTNDDVNSDEFDDELDAKINAERTMGVV